MMRWTAGNKNELIIIVAGILILSGCGGSSSETPMPLEPAPHTEARRDQSEAPQADEEQGKSAESAATGGAGNNNPQ